MLSGCDQRVFEHVAAIVELAHDWNHLYCFGPCSDYRDYLLTIHSSLFLSLITDLLLIDERVSYLCLT